MIAGQLDGFDFVAEIDVTQVGGDVSGSLVGTKEYFRIKTTINVIPQRTIYTTLINKFSNEYREPISYAKPEDVKALVSKSAQAVVISFKEKDSYHVIHDRALYKIITDYIEHIREKSPTEIAL